MRLKTDWKFRSNEQFSTKNKISKLALRDIEKSKQIMLMEEI